MTESTLLFSCHSNDLQELPDALAQLQRLQIIKLKYNRFQSLPSVLGQLPGLQVASLYWHRHSILVGPLLTLTCWRPRCWSYLVIRSHRWTHKSWPP
jgi:hypothetical protein